jgi:hypothetical protein
MSNSWGPAAAIRRRREERAEAYDQEREAEARRRRQNPTPRERLEDALATSEGWEDIRDALIFALAADVIRDGQRSSVDR